LGRQLKQHDTGKAKLALKLTDDVCLRCYNRALAARDPVAGGRVRARE
jgi:hypothetical protein